jgi:hypothetical protein
MDAVQSLRKLGFRKWYERALLHSHAHLVLLLLSTVGLLVGAEAYSRELPVASQLLLFGCIIASGLIGFWALRRYFSLLQHAEFVADQAVCSQCSAYARWDITAEDRTQPAMQVRCRRCGHVWRIELAPG